MREKKEKERKKERKDSPHFQNQSKRERGMTKEFKQKFKISHTCTSWSKCMTWISLDPVFDLATLCDASMPCLSYLLKAPYKPFVRIIQILSDQVYHSRNLTLFYKIFKTSGKKFDQRMNDKCFCETVLSCNHPRHGEANKLHK